MSHVCLTEADREDQQIKDLDALEKAAVRCGLVFLRNQKTFRTWATDHGKLVGDWKVPKGYTEAEITAGGCEHAIGIPGKHKQTGTAAYEIGIVPSRKYPGTYSLMYDFFGGAIDKYATQAEDNEGRLNVLHRMYRVEAAKNALKKKMITCVEKLDATTGRIVLHGTKLTTH